MSEQSTCDRMNALIEAERDALLSGDLERVADLLGEKEGLIEELNQQGDDLETLAPIRAGLRRNQELFDHALSGLRTVVSRLGSLQHLSKSLETYDAQGRRTCIEAPRNQVERRA